MLNNVPRLKAVRYRLSQSIASADPKPSPPFSGSSSTTSDGRAPTGALTRADRPSRSSTNSTTRLPADGARRPSQRQRRCSVRTSGESWRPRCSRERSSRQADSFIIGGCVFPTPCIRVLWNAPPRQSLNTRSNRGVLEHIRRRAGTGHHHLDRGRRQSVGGETNPCWRIVGATYAKTVLVTTGGRNRPA